MTWGFFLQAVHAFFASGGALFLFLLDVIDEKRVRVREIRI